MSQRPEKPASCAVALEKLLGPAQGPCLPRICRKASRVVQGSRLAVAKARDVLRVFGLQGLPDEAAIVNKLKCAPY